MHENARKHSVRNATLHDFARILNDFAMSLNDFDRNFVVGKNHKNKKNYNPAAGVLSHKNKKLDFLGSAQKTVAINAYNV